MDNYVPYHVHTDLSNCTTNVDSVTKFGQYVEKAASLGMKAFGFSEHGNIYEWFHKKQAIENAGMKYIHAVEAYVTMNEVEKVRDSYHVVLIAKNKLGFFEINKLVSGSYNRSDAHFYYVPRIFMSDLEKTSDNVIITTACLGGALNPKEGFEGDEQRFIRFILQNKDRCFLEIQHHIVPEQAAHNAKLLRYSKQYGVRLIAGTDSHALNDTHLKGRKKLQEGKGIHFADEESWALSFMSLDELIARYQSQNSVPKEVYLEAIDNTNYMASLVESFEVDASIKYPNVFESPDEMLKDVVYEYAEKHPYAIKRHGRDKVFDTIDQELAAFKKTGQSCYMLLLDHLCKWEREHGERVGYGRGSVSGSMSAYVMGVTDMDSIKFDLNFFRFCNPDRVSLADVDIDHSDADRAKTKAFLLDEHMGFPTIKTAEIITFNTIQTKGAIRDIARSMDIPLNEVSKISKSIDNDGNVPDDIKKQYKELFEYVDIVSGTIVSYGSHPCGVLVSDRDIDQEIGLCSSSSSAYPITCLNMKELDALNYVKWDVLGLDAIDLINTTCDVCGIDRINPDNIDLNDDDVWKSIRDDNTCIFQFESDQAGAYLRKFMSDENIALAKKRDENFSMIKWLSFANGLLRPGCASYRDDVADGKTCDNGCEAINAFLAKEAGHICFQETIMRFLVEFCGYSNSESDTVRRAIAKKKGTETLLPEIERRFVEYAPKHYDISTQRAKETIKGVLQVILDASDYSFSWNHSDAYSCIGYAIGYLRHYHPLEFVAAALNVYKSDLDKTAKIVSYAQHNNIKLSPPLFGHSRSGYVIDDAGRTIYKGLSSIKYMNSAVADELYEAASNTVTGSETFIDVLRSVSNTSIDTRQLDILVSLDFFKAYGNAVELSAILWIYRTLNAFKGKSIKKETLKNDTHLSPILQFVGEYATDVGVNGKELKSYTITDWKGLMSQCAKMVFDLHIADNTFREKCEIQQEYLGYIDLVTGKKEDRQKLYVLDVRPLRSAKNNSIWAYAVFTRSVGTGKNGRLSIREWRYASSQFQKGDIIYLTDYHKERGYWYADDYQII